MTHKIFISYRHDDGGHAGRIYDHLTREFSQTAVFYDYENLTPGCRYRDALDKAIRAARVFLAVIGQHWLSPINHQRLHESDDVTACEIRAALECIANHSSYFLLPVLTGGADMPKRDDLPQDIADLTEIQAHRLEEKHYYLYMNELIDLLVANCGIQRMLGTGDGNIVIDRRTVSNSGDSVSLMQQRNKAPVTGGKPT